MAGRGRWAAIDKLVTNVLPSIRKTGFMETALRMTASYPRIPCGETSFRRILAPPATDGRLHELFRYAGEHGVPIHILIDEYDNFADTVLVHRGREAYESLTHGGGFYHNFFAALKAGTGEAGGLERLFITGVPPIAMDDVTSGLDTGENVTLEPELDGMLGFTEPEVQDLPALYRERGAFGQDVDAALDMDSSDMGLAEGAATVRMGVLRS